MIVPGGKPMELFHMVIFVMLGAITAMLSCMVAVHRYTR
jgi:hypothetical protein